jgi:hypothetical protein
MPSLRLKPAQALHRTINNLLIKQIYLHMYTYTKENKDNIKLGTQMTQQKVYRHSTVFGHGSLPILPVPPMHRATTLKYCPCRRCRSRQPCPDSQLPVNDNHMSITCLQKPTSSTTLPMTSSTVTVTAT